MLDEKLEREIIEYLLGKIEKKHREYGRLLLREENIPETNQIVMWAIRDDVREIFETTIVLDEYPDVEIHITFARPQFFWDVVLGKEEITFWQMATVARVLQTGEIIYDPQSILKDLKQKAQSLKWPPALISHKINTAEKLISRSHYYIREDMLGDAYMWMVKAFEEAICVPLMKENEFRLTGGTFLLEILKKKRPEFYEKYQEILHLDRFTPEKLERARKELEQLGDRLYHMNVNTRREMWILTGFVSINESERRLQQALKAREQKLKAEFVQFLLETAAVELWQAVFSIAQTPKRPVPLDPWLVGFFSNWFLNDIEDLEITITRHLKYIQTIIEEN